MIETFVQPNGSVAAAHVHPGQGERFEILRGSVGFAIGRKKLVAGPGKRPAEDWSAASACSTSSSTGAATRSWPRCRLAAG
jgi:hypothetical protein